jgi:hypothetical protein
MYIEDAERSICHIFWYLDGTRSVSENNYDWNNKHIIFDLKLLPCSEYYIFCFWVISRRLSFIFRRFGTLCSIFVGGVSRKNNWNKFFLLTSPKKVEQSVPKRRQIKFRSRILTQKKEYNNNVLYNMKINATSVTFCCFQIFCYKYFHMFYYISLHI